MYYYDDKAEQKSVDDMDIEACRTELDELRDEYRRLQLLDEIETLIRKLPTITDLENVLEATKEVYEAASNVWYFLHPVRDNIVTIANNLCDNLNYEELNMICSATIDALERDGNMESLKGVCATKSMYPYLKAAMDRRKAEI